MSSDKQLRRFKGASKYILDEELSKIVNVSIAIEMPLLLKGERVREKPCWLTR